MRLNLERLDSGGLDLALGAEPASNHRISLGATKGLRGSLWQQEDVVRLSEVAADSLVVALLQLTFDTFAVTLHAEGAISHLTGDYSRGSQRTELHLVARTLRAPDLAVQFRHFQARGALHAEHVRIDVSGTTGRVSAESLQLDDATFTSTVSLRAEHLKVSGLDVSWDAHGYEVRVGELSVPRASVEFDLPGSAGATDAGRESASSRPTNAEQGRRALLDWNVLDGVSGSVDVDLFADLDVPVLGSRQAKHPFRVSIQAGTVNYRELEGNLSSLEDAVLDFSVREDALVLERGIPLLPTRGKGKKLVIWPLSQSDLALANQDRVRLAVLPQWQLPTSEESDPEGGRSPEAESKGSGSGLRQLSFVNLQALLRLEPSGAPETALRNLSVGELLVQGTVHHRAEGEPPTGEVTGALRGLGGQMVHLPLGRSHLDLGTFVLGQVTRLRAPFRGLRPQSLNLELADLQTTALSLGNRSA